MNNIIIFAVNNVGDGFSGGDRIFIELARRWKKEAHITLYGSEEAIRIARERGIDGIDFVQADGRNRFGHYTTFGLVWHAVRRLFKGVVAVVRDPERIKNADYVYSVSDFMPDLIPALVSKMFARRAKWVAGFYLFIPSPLSNEFHYRGRHFVKGALYWFSQQFGYLLIKHFADYVFVINETERRRFVTKKRDISKIFAIRGGVDISKSEEYLKSDRIIPVNQRTYDACFVGRFHVQKGALELVDIWSLVCRKDPGRKLVMIGDGELVEQVAAKIGKLGLTANIELAGFADGERKYGYFRNSKIILHPSIYETGGMAAAEGMAWGLPGVCFDHEALRSYYPAGLLKVPPGDTEKFAEAVLKLVGDEALYRKTSSAAHDLIVCHWNWETRAKEALAVLTQIYATH